MQELNEHIIMEDVEIYYSVHDCILVWSQMKASTIFQDN